MKTTMLRLRNRILNRFKKTKVSPRKRNLVITKKVKNTLGFVEVKKTLRVVPRKPVSGKTSPQKYTFGKMLAAALLGHRRVVLRNRRLMGSPRSAMVSASA